MYFHARGQEFTEMSREEAKAYQFEATNRDVEFLAMHYLEKSEFYEDAKSHILIVKSKG